MPEPCLSAKGPAQAPWLSAASSILPLDGKSKVVSKMCRGQTGGSSGGSSFPEDSPLMDPCVLGVLEYHRGGCNRRVSLGPSAMAFSHLWLAEQKLVAVTSHQDRLRIGLSGRPGRA